MEQTTKNSITPRATDFAAWYQDVILAAQFVEHSDVKGAMVFKPDGYALWESIQAYLDQQIKATGHKNVYFPLLIPKSYLSKEAAHVEGFAKEMLVVTHHRLKGDGAGAVVVDPEAKLAEELIIRPTSETIIHATFARWIKSWRDLPVLINQWANVVRWELRPRLFLRTTEFLWQEGHTAHATEGEAETEAKKMLEVYRTFAETILAVPVIAGQKTEAERFPGALRTYTIEAMMQDGKALQAGTSHNLGQQFAKAFEVQYLDQDNHLQYTWMTSWGVSTRLIGGLIMTHSDDKGIVLPPRIAPIQAVIIPIWKTETEQTAVLTAAQKLADDLQASGIRVEVDERDWLTMGEKFYSWEKKGVPVRLELGPRDLAAESIVIVRRDTSTKETQPLAKASQVIQDQLDTIQADLLASAQKRLTEQTKTVTNYEMFRTEIEAGGFFRAFWCGDGACEAVIKEETKATIRCLPFDQPKKFGPCLKCGRSRTAEVILARAY